MAAAIPQAAINPSIYEMLEQFNYGPTISSFHSPRAGPLGQIERVESFVTDVEQGLTLDHTIADATLNHGVKLLITIADTLHDFSERPKNKNFLETFFEKGGPGPSAKTQEWATNLLEKFLLNNTITVPYPLYNPPGAGPAGAAAGPAGAPAHIPPPQSLHANAAQAKTLAEEIIQRIRIDPEAFTYFYLYWNDFHSMQEIGIVSIADSVSFPNASDGNHTSPYYATPHLMLEDAQRHSGAMSRNDRPERMWPFPVNYLFKPGDVVHRRDYTINGRVVGADNLTQDSYTGLAYLLRDFQAHRTTHVKSLDHYVPKNRVYFSLDNGGASLPSALVAEGVDDKADAYQCYTNGWKYDNNERDETAPQSPEFIDRDDAGPLVELTGNTVTLNKEAITFFDNFTLYDNQFSFTYTDDVTNPAAHQSHTRTFEYGLEHKRLVKSLGQHLATLMARNTGTAYIFQVVCSFSIAALDLISELFGDCVHEMIGQGDDVRIDNFWHQNDNLLAAFFDLKRVGDYVQCKELNSISAYKENCIPLITFDKICSCISHKIFGNYTILSKRYPQTGAPIKEVLMLPFSKTLHLARDPSNANGDPITYARTRFPEYTNYVHPRLDIPGGPNYIYPKAGLPSGNAGYLNQNGGGKGSHARQVANKKFEKNSFHGIVSQTNPLKVGKVSRTNTQTNPQKVQTIRKDKVLDKLLMELESLQKCIKDHPEFELIRIFKGMYWARAEEWWNLFYENGIDPCDPRRSNPAAPTRKGFGARQDGMMTSKLLIQIKYPIRENYPAELNSIVDVFGKLLKKFGMTGIHDCIYSKYIKYLTQLNVGQALSDIEKSEFIYLEKFIIIMIANDNFLKIFKKMYYGSWVNDRKSIYYYIQFIIQMEKISIDIPSWDAGQVMQMGGRVKLPPHIMQRKQVVPAYLNINYGEKNLEKKKIEKYESNINKINKKIILLKKHKIKNKDKIIKQNELIIELKHKIKKEKEKEKIKHKKEKEKEKEKLKLEKEKEKIKLKKEKEKIKLKKEKDMVRLKVKKEKQKKEKLKKLK